MPDPTQQPEAVQEMAEVPALTGAMQGAGVAVLLRAIREAASLEELHDHADLILWDVWHAVHGAHLAQHPDQAGTVVPDQWRPIETVPRDGEFVDLWVHDSLRQEGERWTDCRCSYGLWFTAETERVAAYDWLHITHWRPLPTPPAEPSP